MAAPPGSGFPGLPPVQAEITLECIYALGVDLARCGQHSPVLTRTCETAQTWVIGRQQQPEYFIWLVPDEVTRNTVSRSHFELVWDPRLPDLMLKRLTTNVLLLNSAPTPLTAVPVPTGSHIGCCSPGSPAPFLIFRVGWLVKPIAGAQAAWQQQQLLLQQQQQLLQQLPHLPQTLPHNQGPLGGQPPPPQEYKAPPWRDAAPAAPLALVGSFAFGRDLSAVPPEAKSIGVYPDGPVLLGRQQQLGFFEGLLGEGNRYLPFVSRSHIELMPIPGRAGCFRALNVSHNPVIAGDKQLAKGENCVVQVPVSFFFIAAHADTGKPMTYFILDFGPRLERPDDLLGTQITIPPAQPGSQRQASAPTPPQAPATQSPRYGPDGMPIAESAPGPPPQHGVPAPPPPASPQWSEEQGVPPSAALFWLELAGTAVRPDFPASLRRIGGGEEGVTVGRSRQKRLHADALSEEVAQYVSREHFRVARHPSGMGFAVTPQGSNLMWLVRGGERTELRGQGSWPLASGDVIQLFTGAADQTPYGLEFRGTLYWMFYTATGSADVTAPVPVVHAPQQPVPSYHYLVDTPATPQAMAPRNSVPGYDAWGGMAESPRGSMQPCGWWDPAPPAQAHSQGLLGITQRMEGAAGGGCGCGGIAAPGSVQGMLGITQRMVDFSLGREGGATPPPPRSGTPPPRGDAAAYGPPGYGGGFGPPSGSSTTYYERAITDG